jgi:hypothetical protein
MHDFLNSILLMYYEQASDHSLYQCCYAVPSVARMLLILYM